MALVRDAAYSFDERANNVLPLADASVVWRHAALGLSAGRVRSLVAGDVFAGFAGRAVRSDRLATGAPAEQVQVISQGEALLTVAGAVEASLGAAVYASDESTFNLTGGSYIGRVLRVPATGSAWVAFDAPNQAAGQMQALVSVAGNLAAAAVSSTSGTPGEVRRISDGDNAGALVVWAIPQGASTYTWCWWLWPQAAY